MLAYQWQQRLTQAKQVPVSNVGLLVVGVSALRVGVVANVRRVKRIQKLERAVVNCQTQNTHVVGVHHAVAKTYRLPGSHQVGGAFTDRFQKRSIWIGRIAASRIKAVDHKVGQGFEFNMHIVITEVLKMAKADKAGRSAGHDSSSLNFFSQNFGVRACQAQCPGGWYAQAVHCLRT